MFTLPCVYFNRINGVFLLVDLIHNQGWRTLVALLFIYGWKENKQMKYNQPCPGFELGLPITFLSKITVTLNTPLLRLKSSVTPTIYPYMVVGRIIGFIPFQRELALSEMPYKTALSRFRTRVFTPISSAGDYYTTNVFLYNCVTKTTTSFRWKSF